MLTMTVLAMKIMLMVTVMVRTDNNCRADGEKYGDGSGDGADNDDG